MTLLFEHRDTSIQWYTLMHHGLLLDSQVVTAASTRRSSRCPAAAIVFTGWQWFVVSMSHLDIATGADYCCFPLSRIWDTILSMSQFSNQLMTAVNHFVDLDDNKITVYKQSNCSDFSTTKMDSSAFSHLSNFLVQFKQISSLSCLLLL